MSQVIQKLRESQIYQDSLKASDSFLTQKSSAKSNGKLQATMEKNEEDGNSKSTSKENQRAIKQEPNEQGKNTVVIKFIKFPYINLTILPMNCNLIS